MPRWVCEECGYTLWCPAPQAEECPICGGKMVKGPGISLEEEEEESEDHYSFWRGCPMGRLWDPGWGPFGPRRGR